MASPSLPLHRGAPGEGRRPAPGTEPIGRSIGSATLRMRPTLNHPAIGGGRHVDHVLEGVRVTWDDRLQELDGPPSVRAGPSPPGPGDRRRPRAGRRDDWRAAPAEPVQNPSVLLRAGKVRRNIRLRIFICPGRTSFVLYEHAERRWSEQWLIIVGLARWLSARTPRLRTLSGRLATFGESTTVTGTPGRQRAGTIPPLVHLALPHRGRSRPGVPPFLTTPSLRTSPEPPAPALRDPAPPGPHRSLPGPPGAFRAAACVDRPRAGTSAGPGHGLRSGPLSAHHGPGLRGRRTPPGRGGPLPCGPGPARSAWCSTAPGP